MIRLASNGGVSVFMPQHGGDVKIRKNKNSRFVKFSLIAVSFFKDACDQVGGV